MAIDRTPGRHGRTKTIGKGKDSAELSAKNDLQMSRKTADYRKTAGLSYNPDALVWPKANPGREVPRGKKLPKNAEILRKPLGGR